MINWQYQRMIFLAVNSAQYFVFALLIWMVVGAFLQAYQTQIAVYFSGNEQILNGIARIYNVSGIAALAGCIASFMLILFLRLKKTWG